MLGMGGDEDHRRRGAGAVAPARRQPQPVAPGQADVEQHQVDRLARQHRFGLGRVFGLADHRQCRLGDVLQQGAQAQPRRGFVVDQQHAQHRRHIGSTMRA